MSGGSEKKGILFEKNLVFEVIIQPTKQLIIMWK